MKPLKALITILFLTVLSVSAQTKSTFGVKGGLNIASTTNSTGVVNSFSAGAFADIKLTRALYFQPGVFYSGKGLKQLPTPSYSTTRIRYINVPLNFVYKLAAGPGNFFIGAGPFVAVAVSATEKGYGSSNYDSPAMSHYEVKVPIGNDNRLEDASYNNLKRMEYGATALAGYHLKNGLLLSVNYDLGLTSIRYSSSYKTRVLGISVGYTF